MGQLLIQDEVRMQTRLGKDEQRNGKPFRLLKSRSYIPQRHVHPDAALNVYLFLVKGTVFQGCIKTDHRTDRWLDLRSPGEHRLGAIATAHDPDPFHVDL